MLRLALLLLERYFYVSDASVDFSSAQLFQCLAGDHAVIEVAFRITCFAVECSDSALSEYLRKPVLNKLAILLANGSFSEKHQVLSLIFNLLRISYLHTDNLICFFPFVGLVFSIRQWTAKRSISRIVCDGHLPSDLFAIRFSMRRSSN
jgi:hypothetical protein